MENDEDERQFLSDVHISTIGENLGKGLRVSRFFFRIPETGSQNKNSVGSSSVQDLKNETAHDIRLTRKTEEGLHNKVSSTYEDEDGDLIISRQPSQQQRVYSSALSVATDNDAVITLEHASSTLLKDVGQQVWSGALLLCDFMLHTWYPVHQVIVLDLGAGAGLTSIVAALMAKVVFCTDMGDCLLKLAQRNVEINAKTLALKGEVRVRELDWNIENLPFPDVGQCQTGSKFSFTAEDLQVLENCSVILAAEVVYDVELTDVFFRLLYHLMMRPPAKTLYLTVEKRQVFSTAHLDVVSPAYEQFRENLAELASVDEGPVRFVCSRVETSFPLYFRYQRVKELELWKVEVVFGQKTAEDLPRPQS